MPTTIEAQGHTVDEAIQIALNQLGVSRDKVEIEIVHHPRRGVLGIGARRAKVRATIRESVMLDGEEFDMSGGDSLDDKPRRRRRRGGRTRGGARGEEGAEGAEGSPRVAAPAEPGREGARLEGGRGRDDAGRQRDGRRDDRRGGRGRGGERPADAQQRGGQQQQRAVQGRGQGGRPERAQDRTERPERQGPDRQGQDRQDRQGQERQGQDRQDRQDRQGRQGRQRGGDQRRDRDDRGQRPAQPDAAAPEPSRVDSGQGALQAPAEGLALSAPSMPEAIPAPELPVALPASRRSPASEEPPLDAEALEMIRARAEELVRELLARMGFAAEISSSVDEAAGEAVVAVRSDSEGLLIGRRGQTLDSLEHIVNRMVLRGEAYVEGRIQLDIGDYRKRRRESLEELATRLRTRAVTEKRSVQVSPMSPRDRRYFSQAFAGDDAVEVRALGAGFYRRVIVAPAGMGGVGGIDPVRDMVDSEDASADVETTAGLEAEH